MAKFKDFSRTLSALQVLFKANLIFKDFQDSHVYSSSFQACGNPDSDVVIFKDKMAGVYFSSIGVTLQI